MPNKDRSIAEMFDLINYDDQRSLLLMAVQEINATEHLNIDCINYRELPDYLKRIDREPYCRKQLIVNYADHFTAVDILITARQKSCIIIDAAHNPKVSHIIRTINNHDENYVITMPYTTSWNTETATKLQNDSASCSLFAFDHAKQLALEPDEFHRTIQDGASNTTTTHTGPFKSQHWDALPSNFLWNVQSTRFIDNYRQRMGSAILDTPRHPHQMSFNQYVNAALINDPKLGGRPRNTGVYHVLPPQTRAHLFALFEPEGQDNSTTEVVETIYADDIQDDYQPRLSLQTEMEKTLAQLKVDTDAEEDKNTKTCP